MPRSKKTIGLPLSKELKTDKLKDIQHHFELYREALDRMYQYLLSDITTIQIGDGSVIVIGLGDWIYFGGVDQVGSARIGLVGTEWVCQHFISGTYKSRLGSAP